MDNALASRAGVKQSQVRGEPGTGYENGKLGEFECENCSWFSSSDSSCGQATMVRISKQPRLPSGRVKVDPEGCCSYVHRIGKIEPHEQEEEAAYAVD